MKKVFIFGGSFSVDEGGWTDTIRNNYKLVNFSFGGASCSQILEKIKRQIDNINLDDFVIICWSDMNREYLNQLWINLDHLKIKETYINNLNSAKKILEDRKINHLIIWALPSDYGKTRSWTTVDFAYLDKEKYEYIVNFKNEIRPALIYFSRKELLHITDDNELVNAFKYDKRPNHIRNLKIHILLSDAIIKFIEEEITGIYYIED